MKELSRDKKSLLMMLLVSLLVPLLIIGMSYVFNLEVNKSYNYKIGFSYKLSAIEKEIINNLAINPIYDNIDNLEKMFLNKKIDLYITKNNNHYIIYSNNDNNSIMSIILSEKYLSLYKEYLQKEELNKYEISNLEEIITFEKRIVNQHNFYQLYINFFGFLFIIMAITVSATYPATDTTAGEKERGTLETLLTFPINIKDIMLGKFFAITISSMMPGIISFILMIISLNIVNKMFSIYKYINLIPSFNILIFLLLIIIIYSFLISGLWLFIASFAKTFKEAQSSLTLLTFLSFIPGMFVFSFSFSKTIILSLIPFFNIYIVYFNLINGIINYQEIIFMIFSSFIVIIFIFLFIIKYNKEKLLFS